MTFSIFPPFLLSFLLHSFSLFLPLLLLPRSSFYASSTEKIKEVAESITFYKLECFSVGLHSLI